MAERRKWKGNRKLLQVAVLGFLTLYIGGLLVIFVAAPNQTIDAFPSSCPDDSRNCSRIAPEPYRATGATELVVNASKEEVVLAVVDWINSEPRTQVISQSEDVGYVHSVFRSFMWRFPDDLLVHVHCDDGAAHIWVHSESRLGIDDLGVNKERVLDFADVIESNQWSGAVCE